MIKALCLIYLIWGMNWVVMKTANSFFPPITFVAYRFLFGAAVLLSVWLWLRLPLPKKKYWPWIFLTGILQMGLNNIAAQTSMVTLGAGMVSVLNYSMPVFAAVMAHFLLGEKLTWRKGFGIVLALAGMAVLMDVHAGGDVTAIFIGLLSAVFWGLASIFVKLKLSDVNAISLTTWQMVCASLTLLVYTTAVPQGPVIWNKESILCLLYNGVLGDRRPQGGNVLTRQTLAAIREHLPPDFDGELTVYGERSALTGPSLIRERIVFRQTPYDVKVRR